MSGLKVENLLNDQLDLSYQCQCYKERRAAKCKPQKPTFDHELIYFTSTIHEIGVKKKKKKTTCSCIMKALSITKGK